MKSCKMVSVSVSSTIFMSNVNHRTNEMSRTWCIATKLSSAEVIRPVPLIYTLKKVHSSTLREVLSVLVIWRWWGVTQYIENSHSVLKELSTHTGMSKCFGHAMRYNMGELKSFKDVPTNHADMYKWVQTLLLYGLLWIWRLTHFLAYVRPSLSIRNGL